MFGRPKFGETDEDILRLQEEFFKQKSEKKVNVSTKYVGVSGSEKQRFSNDNIVLSPENDGESSRNKDDLSERMVVGKIIERKTDYVTCVNDNVQFKTGFPQAKRRQATPASKSGSIFSQQSKKLCSKRQNEPQKMEIDPQPSTSISEYISTQKLQEKIKNLPPKSYIVEGEVKEDIHKENIDKLKDMTEEEIIEEQKKLLDSLDPEIVKFFKSKRKHDEIDVIEEKKEDMKIIEDIVEAEEIDTAKEIIEKSDRWLNFDKIETEKIQWMKNIVIPKNPKNDQEYEARFDFDGWLLPYKDTEITEKNRILYHHGNESGRPGYSLQELFKLCRSDVQQQRILALNTISNILALQSTGVYENLLNIPIEQIFFVIRIAMDDNTPSVLNASVKAMHNLFYSQIDEICLDGLLGFGEGSVQPIITVEKEDMKENEREDEKETNDQQIAELDLVKCLMRTDILIRIRYIINIIQPSIETITYCLELLIRLMRDFKTVVNQVYNCENLFESIIKHFVPKIYQLNSSATSAYSVPNTTAIKLLRITACRDIALAKDLAEKYNILDSIISYISTDIGANVIGIKIQTESLNLLAVYMHYNINLEFFNEVVPFLIRNLEYHLNKTDIKKNSSYIKQAHFSAVVNVISQVGKINIKLIEIFVPYLMRCVSKYFVQISSLSSNVKCGHLQIISSLLFCLQNKIETNSYSKEIISFIESKGFAKITNNIKSGSNLLSEYECLKSSPNLKYLESVVWKTSEHVVPVLLTSSCLPFLRSLSAFISTCSTEVQIKFLTHPNIKRYITQLKDSDKYYLTTNWFTKTESEVVVNVLKIVVSCQHNLENPNLYFELAIKCLGLFGTELKKDIEYILKNIVFNTNFHPIQMEFEKMGFDDSNLVKKCLENLEEILGCYSKILGFENVSKKDFPELCLDVRLGSLVPIDWIFSPIVLLYAQQENVPETQKEIIITRCLEWIFLYETYFPVLSSLVNTTDRYCRLCCVFLSSNSLFLEEDIQKLLKCTLDLLLTEENYKQINFDKDIQGLNNFQDFYTELLEHYQGVSYGNKLFANFVLIPLAQKHNKKWRKTLWSEYMGVAQIINLTPEECILDLKEFLEPLEEDISLLKSYRKALITKQLSRSPLLKEIANYHVEHFVKRKKEMSE